MTNETRYMAIDQYGQTYHIGKNPPRKWLMNHVDCQHAEKMYADTNNDRFKHIGYVIAGRWFRLYCVTPWEGKT